MEEKEGKILVIDDDRDIRLTAHMVLKKHFRQIELWEGPDPLSQGEDIGGFDLVLLDMNFKPGASDGEAGLYWIREIHRRHPDVAVVVITAYGDVNLAVQAMKLGAVDFVVKPWENQRFLATVQSAYRLGQSRQEIRDLRFTQQTLQHDMDQASGTMVADSPAMQDVLKTIEKVAATDVNVLILGENGTGKELVAREIHRRSLRSNKIFMHVDLGAIPETLFESELFGHVKGAFTDARDDRKGRFEMAHQGTLFLDEIGNLSLSLQSKLLTAIQRKEITRVGSSHPVEVDVRLICATNMPLKKMVAADNFREDLLYRINTLEISLPPLRDRTSDIPGLSKHFMDHFRRKYRKPNLTLSSSAMDKLMRYHWPGNIRELQHILERTVIMAENNEIRSKDIKIETHSGASSNYSSLNLEEIEKNTILKALRKHHYNLSATARELGLGRTTLYRKMNKYEL